MMTHVNKIGFPGSYSLCIVQSLLQILVGMVRLRTQCIHYQHIQSLQQIIFSPRHRQHIGNPCHPADTVSQNGQFAVHYPKRCHLYFVSFGIADNKRRIGNNAA